MNLYAWQNEHTHDDHITGAMKISYFFQAEQQNTEKQAAQDVEAAMSTEKHATKLEQSSAI